VGEGKGWVGVSEGWEEGMGRKWGDFGREEEIWGEREIAMHVKRKERRRW
jgi:hypothetical protein